MVLRCPDGVLALHHPLNCRRAALAGRDNLVAGTGEQAGLGAGPAAAARAGRLLSWADKPDRAQEAGSCAAPGQPARCARLVSPCSRHPDVEEFACGVEDAEALRSDLVPFVHLSGTLKRLTQVREPALFLLHDGSAAEPVVGCGYDLDPVVWHPQPPALASMDGE